MDDKLGGWRLFITVILIILLLHNCGIGMQLDRMEQKGR